MWNKTEETCHEHTHSHTHHYRCYDSLFKLEILQKSITEISSVIILQVLRANGLASLVISSVHCNFCLPLFFLQITLPEFSLVFHRQLSSSDVLPLTSIINIFCTVHTLKKLLSYTMFYMLHILHVATYTPLT